LNNAYQSKRVPLLLRLNYEVFGLPLDENTINYQKFLASTELPIHKSDI